VLVLGIDPGPTESAYCYITLEQAVNAANKTGNEGLIEMVRSSAPSTGHVAIESIQSYGMLVGREVFDTCFMIGRLIQVCKDHGIPFTLYPRPEYTRRICGVGKINDAVLRQALLLRFGGDRKGEPLYALKGCTDKRSAYAVAVYHIDVTTHERRAVHA
jgi:hypothetical protein